MKKEEITVTVNVGEHSFNDGTNEISLKPLTKKDLRNLKDFLYSLPKNSDFEDFDEYLDEVEIHRRRFLKQELGETLEQKRLRSIACVCVDLSRQGWSFKLDGKRIRGLLVRKINNSSSIENKKNYNKKFLLASRSDHLRKPSVKTFLQKMEKPKYFKNESFSIFDLMANGEDIKDKIEKLNFNTELKIEDMLEIVDPYFQIAEKDSVCPETGLKLSEIWRYFRLLWSNPPASVPGREMHFLVRDASLRSHPIIGIGSLSSAVIANEKRDEFLGWRSTKLNHKGTLELKHLSVNEAWRWIGIQMQDWLDSIYIEDLIEQEILSLKDLISLKDSFSKFPYFDDNTSDSEINNLIEKLLIISEKSRKSHRDNLTASKDFKKNKANKVENWEIEARKQLFKAKRCRSLVDLFKTYSRLKTKLSNLSKDEHPIDYLCKENVPGKALNTLINKVKQKHLAGSIADLTVCGAVPPYTNLLGGKLVSALSISPTLVKDFYDRYKDSVSIISSSMAGKQVIREAKLALVTTTSLYGIRPSQYDRISVNFEETKTNKLHFKFLGRTQGTGSVHLSEQSLKEMKALLSQLTKGKKRVNYIFGEGVSPRMRNLREGLTAVGFDTDKAMKHHMPRGLYVAPLANNLTKYIMGIDKRPNYGFSLSSSKTKNNEFTKQIVSWWFNRWIKPRLTEKTKLNLIKKKLLKDNLSYPIKHSARVKSLRSDLEQLQLFNQ